jgi:alpha-beta hydrolase superfamily lysophospholipase
MDIVQKGYKFKSSEGHKDIYVRALMPLNKSEALGVIQIVHEISQTSESYRNFAGAMLAKGFAVFVHDQLGHGLSAGTPEDMGHFADADGWAFLLRDTLAVTDYIRRLFRGKPVFLVGVGAGSLIARCCCEYTRSKFAGAVFINTTANDRSNIANIRTAKFVVKRKGPRYKSRFLTCVALGKYGQRMNYDWVSGQSNDSEQNFVLTAAAYLDMFKILADCSSRKWYKNLPQNMPILLITGENDPVGRKGLGIGEIFHNLRKISNCKVHFISYKNAGHNLFNNAFEESLINDISGWALSQIGKAGNL